MEIIELELCPNCKKEIPQTNYVMHTAHCARNITLCSICKEPVAKAQLESHKRDYHVGNFGETISSTQSVKKANQRSSSNVTNGFDNNTNRTAVNTDKATAQGQEKVGLNQKSTAAGKNGGPKSDLLACKFCDLELSKSEIADHENYCGSRTDKCMTCGEIVMFKYKKIHEETNHGFLKLNDEPGPRPTWDSSSQRSASSAARATNSGSPFSDGNYRPMPLRTASLLDTTLYSFPEEYRPPVRQNKANAESYKQITRRLDCKTEYIRNLLHDSASITVPIRTNAMTPRNRFCHNKGPAPLPPTPSTSSRAQSPPLLSPTTPTAPMSFTASPLPYAPYTPTLDDLPTPPLSSTSSATRRSKPPTELCVPCDYCTLVLPHRDLVEHEAVCGRSYLSTERAQASARRRREGLDDMEWGNNAAQQGQVYSFDGDDGDRYYCAYKTSGPNGEEPGGRGMDGVGGGSVSTSAAAKNNSNAVSPFDFRPAHTHPLTVSSLLGPAPSPSYTPSRPSLVSTLGGSTSSTTIKHNQAASATNSTLLASQQSCAGAAAAAASGNISPEVQLPCEFCADMIPASQLLRHQATCF